MGAGAGYRGGGALGNRAGCEKIFFDQITDNPELIGHCHVEVNECSRFLQC